MGDRQPRQPRLVPRRLLHRVAEPTYSPPSGVPAALERSARRKTPQLRAPLLLKIRERARPEPQKALGWRPLWLPLLRSERLVLGIAMMSRTAMTNGTKLKDVALLSFMYPLLRIAYATVYAYVIHE